jgi:membrane protein
MAPPAGRPRAVLARAASITVDGVVAVRDAAVRFYNSNDLTYASSIAYFSLLSLFPCLMLLLALLGQVAASEDDRARLFGFLLAYFPRQFEFLTLQIDAFRGQRITLGVAGSVLTAWAALGVFGAITTAMNYAWRVEKQPNYVKHKLVSFLMMAAAGGLTFLGLIFVSAQGVVRASWFAAALEARPAFAWLTGLAASSATTILFVFVVGLIFYFVPNTNIRFRDVWLGALLTGLLWKLALAGFSWYVRDLSRFSIHGSIAAVVVFLLWVYLWSVILIFGAEYSAAYSQLRAMHRPKED